jgi:hypothetical protein
MKNYILVNPLKEQRFSLKDLQKNQGDSEKEPEEPKPEEPKPEEPKPEEPKPEAEKKKTGDQKPVKPAQLGVEPGEYTAYEVTKNVLETYFPGSKAVLKVVETGEFRSFFDGLTGENITRDKLKDAIKSVVELLVSVATEEDFFSPERLSGEAELAIDLLAGVAYAEYTRRTINKLRSGEKLVLQRALGAGLDKEKVAQALANYKGKPSPNWVDKWVQAFPRTGRFRRYVIMPAIEGAYLPIASRIYNASITSGASTDADADGWWNRQLKKIQKFVPAAEDLKDIDIKADLAVFRSMQNSIDTGVEFGEIPSEEDIKKLHNKLANSQKKVDNSIKELEEKSTGTEGLSKKEKTQLGNLKKDKRDLVKQMSYLRGLQLKIQKREKALGEIEKSTKESRKAIADTIQSGAVELEKEIDKVEKKLPEKAPKLNSAADLDNVPYAEEVKDVLKQQAFELEDELPEPPKQGASVDDWYKKQKEAYAKKYKTNPKIEIAQQKYLKLQYNSFKKNPQLWDDFKKKGNFDTMMKAAASEVSSSKRNLDALSTRSRKGTGGKPRRTPKLRLPESAGFVISEQKNMLEDMPIDVLNDIYAKIYTVARAQTLKNLKTLRAELRKATKEAMSGGMSSPEAPMSIDPDSQTQTPANESKIKITKSKLIDLISEQVKEQSQTVDVTKDQLVTLVAQEAFKQINRKK